MVIQSKHYRPDLREESSISASLDPYAWYLIHTRELNDYQISSICLGSTSIA